MPENAGAINGYTCDQCGKTTYTVNRDRGTTPFMMNCSHCGRGRAVSRMYRVPADAIATHEWYLPSLRWAKRKGRDMLDHVSRGGMVLRSIDASQKANR